MYFTIRVYSRRENFILSNFHTCAPCDRSKVAPYVPAQCLVVNFHLLLLSTRSRLVKAAPAFLVHVYFILPLDWLANFQFIRSGVVFTFFASTTSQFVLPTRSVLVYQLARTLAASRQHII